MKFWGFLAAKLVVSVVALNYIWAGVVALLPAPRHLLRVGPAFGRDLPFTLAACLFFLLSCGVLALIILDQRYRCRVCLRRLRMPVETGSWGRMLMLGRPRIEYICPYGHGTLKISEVQIDGLEMPNWKQHGDMWTELFEKEETPR